MTELISLIHNHFNHSHILVAKWLRAPNPILGGTSPLDMVEEGNYNKLLNIVRHHIQGDI